jgi:hypothetical protein
MSSAEFDRWAGIAALASAVIALASRYTTAFVVPGLWLCWG